MARTRIGRLDDLTVDELRAEAKKAGLTGTSHLRKAELVEAVGKSRPGRSLVTTHHDAIRQWAERRGAVPATVEGTGHGDLLGVLRFSFGRDDERLREVSWDDWLRTFDERRLSFVYQEERTDGRTSTSFRLENPHREDA